MNVKTVSHRITFTTYGPHTNPRSSLYFFNTDIKEIFYLKFDHEMLFYIYNILLSFLYVHLSFRWSLILVQVSLNFELKNLNLFSMLYSIC